MIPARPNWCADGSGPGRCRRRAGSCVTGRVTICAVSWHAAAGGWTLNGQAQPGLGGCLDLDFGFTPATNLYQLRRIALPVGRGADVPVAWLDASSGTLDLLQQRYERRTIESYWYEAPRFGYRALLHVNAAGFVEDYPGLWRLDP